MYTCIFPSGIDSQAVTLPAVTVTLLPAQALITLLP